MCLPARCTLGEPKMILLVVNHFSIPRQVLKHPFEFTGLTGAQAQLHYKFAQAKRLTWVVMEDFQDFRGRRRFTHGLRLVYHPDGQGSSGRQAYPAVTALRYGSFAARMTTSQNILTPRRICSTGTRSLAACSVASSSDFTSTGTKP